MLSNLPAADLASCLLSCRRLLEAVAEAPVAVRPGRAARQLPTAQLDAIVDAILKYYKGATELDLSGLALEDGQLQRLLAGGLPRLARLHLAGCRKITTRLAGLLCGSAAGGAGAPQRRPRSSSRSGAAAAAAAAQQQLAPAARLELLNLQRCFQLNAQLLAALLAAAAQPRARLQLLAMSHVDFGAFPFAGANSSAGAVAGQQQQQAPLPLAALVQAALQAGAGACGAPPPTAVELLLRGGRPGAGPGDPPALRFSSLRILALTNGTRLGPAAMHALPLACPLLEHLLLGGCTLPGSSGAVALEWPERCAALVRQLRAALPRGASVAGGAGGALVAIGSAASSSGQLVREFAVQLAAMAAQLPRLRALELTLLPPAIVALVRALLRGLPSGRQAEGLMVWDLTEVACVYAALDVLAARGARGTGARQGQQAQQQQQQQQAPGALALALRCAANCSSGSRVSPLHVAAEQGDNAFATGLLELGAAVDARDSGGATPLFLACEAGHAAVVATLLGAGADALLANAAGEAPLYIAALRGHLQVRWLAGGLPGHACMPAGPQAGRSSASCCSRGRQACVPPPLRPGPARRALRPARPPAFLPRRWSRPWWRTRRRRAWTGATRGSTATAGRR